MNRRGFFRSLVATACVAMADRTRLAETTLRIVEDPISVGQTFAEALARRLIETKETLAANILNRAFEPWPEVSTTRCPDQSLTSSGETDAGRLASLAGSRWTNSSRCMTSAPS